jgi:hypothetical protein
MSLEMHVFLEKSRIPNRSPLQDTISSLNLPFVLNPELNLLTDSGFSPSKIQDADSGFEIYSEPAQDIMQNYPHLTETIANRDLCLTFRWSGDLNECACVLSTAAGLVKLCGAVAFYPDDDLIYDLNQLLEETKSCLA